MEKLFISAHQSLYMEINYTIAVALIIAVAALIIFLIRKNNKDKKKMEKEMIDSEIKPEKHDSGHA
jgi:preprotein translocase subunit YajC